MFVWAAPASAEPVVTAGPHQRSTSGLQLGTRGAQVTLLQRDLSAAGFKTAATGVFDATTMKHLVAFQRRYRLRPYGVVQHSTLTKLRSVAVAEEILASPETATTGAISANGLAASGAPTSTTASVGTSPTTTTGGVGSSTGGISFAPGPNSPPVQPATLQGDGLAMPAAGAPQTIREVIAGADMIAFDPYIYGGGHASFYAAGYDCSGSVSFALHAAHLLSSPLDSTQFESWGQPGPGRWITLWANGGHVYMEVDGLFFDTAAQRASNGNDRWSPVRISGTRGFIERHPTGW
jgi:peptidoglycan hydrolase-like protein with peptidoglycan-binding domain